METGHGPYNAEPSPVHLSAATPFHPVKALEAVAYLGWEFQALIVDRLRTALF